VEEKHHLISFHRILVLIEVNVFEDMIRNHLQTFNTGTAPLQFPGQAAGQTCSEKSCDLTKITKLNYGGDDNKGAPTSVQMLGVFRDGKVCYGEFNNMKGNSSAHETPGICR
jgi:hypothetical protein